MESLWIVDRDVSPAILLVFIGSVENEDPENEDPKTHYENEDRLPKRRPTTKTKTPLFFQRETKKQIE